MSSAGRKSEVATSHLPSRGPKKRAELRHNPYTLAGPQYQARGDNQKWLPHPCFVGGPKEGGIATQPLHSRGPPTPTAGRKSELATSRLPSRGPKRGRRYNVTPTFSGVPNHNGNKITIDYLTLTFSRAQKRLNCYIIAAFSGVPNAKRAEKFRSGYLTRAFSGGQKRAEVLCDLRSLGGPQHQARGENQKCLPQPCLLRCPKEGGMAM